MNLKGFAAAALAALIAGGVASRLPAGEPVPQAGVAHTSLKVGDTAPDFTLLDNKWKPVHLGDFRGKKNVVLAFYVLAFTEG
ncbi:MAG: redoxin domain-containing protein [Acidobacteriia bacterium]|nr:redoxin domain-containing protein [Terriglobia bacterium]